MFLLAGMKNLVKKRFPWEHRLDYLINEKNGVLLARQKVSAQSNEVFLYKLASAQFQ